MKRAPVRIRTFILITVLVLLLAPTLAGGAAWFIARDRQEAGIHHRLSTAVTYLTNHREEIGAPPTIAGFGRLLDRLGLLGQVVLAGELQKRTLYVSPGLSPILQKEQVAKKIKAGEAKARESGEPAPPTPSGVGGSVWSDDQRQLTVGTRKSPETLVADLYFRRAGRNERALAALLTGVAALLVGLAGAVWLTNRWMVMPLARLSAQVDKVAGGELALAVPRSRVGEIANIAQAVEGMTAALGETAQRQAEADEARRFLVTSVAHDLRTPLFALRGHLQAIGTNVGDAALHLRRAEARADALERLISNLFAYTRDDYTQPALRLEAVPIADLVRDAVDGLEHAVDLRENTVVAKGEATVCVVVDRDRMKRVLINVIDNALRHSPPRAPIRVSWVSLDESNVQLTVEDDGSGFETGLLPHVFEPGIRGNHSAPGRSDGGAGLGLTIAKRFLEHQHATITAENRPTGGAVITLTLNRSTAGGPQA